MAARRTAPMRAAELGEPQRRFYIEPRESPVPAPPVREDVPAPRPAPVTEPAQVPA